MWRSNYMYMYIVEEAYINKGEGSKDEEIW